MQQKTIEYSPEDTKQLDEFVQQVIDLCRLVIEMIESPATLMSPTLRKMLSDHAKRTEESWNKLHAKLCVDNPGSYKSETETEVYSHPDCVFQFCPYPDSCKPSSCFHRSHAH